ncbi:MAG: hypothetical protein JJT94_08970 [Bernardetiaceae bacterium]|nr:hypothetical protein [Bernardetiaceae bacterium]
MKKFIILFLLFGIASLCAVDAQAQAEGQRLVRDIQQLKPTKSKLPESMTMSEITQFATELSTTIADKYRYSDDERRTLRSAFNRYIGEYYRIRRDYDESQKNAAAKAQVQNRNRLNNDVAPIFKGNFSARQELVNAGL